ncbi:putative ABC transporter permease [Sphaerochaeta sp.]|uniref:putative ABC transporter permease n=1 Tax=Sphaerochaeta sp. TaxID=1972642 RepID=UPI002FCB9424
MQFDLLVCYFFCYALLGYVVEVAYCSIPQKRLVNRGFLHGPYLPIYGFGALLIIQLFSRFTAHPLLVFLLALLVTSLLEYVTSFALELFFHAKLWDYSTHRFNLQGRVCLLNSTLFGLLGLVVLYGIQPFMERLLSHGSASMLSYLSKAIVLVMGIDATSSVFRMTAFQRQLLEFKEKTQEIEQRLSLLSKLPPSQGIELLKEKLVADREQLRSHLHDSANHILDAFPSITSAIEERRVQFELLRMEQRDWMNRRREQRMKFRQDVRAFAKRKRNHD